MTDIDDNTRAKAFPKKAFFVKWITRDITLEDCILDLIDNSVDSAWRSIGSHYEGLSDSSDLSPYSIRISATGVAFAIVDNCGGMSLDDAIEYAFSFGGRDPDDEGNYSIGVYGIGMKRAIFKLGADATVRSTTKQGPAGDQSFRVVIDVNEWSDESTPWDFEINEDPGLPEPGVAVEVTSLSSGASSAFENPRFLQDLRRIISRDYTLHLNRGLNIELNGVPISGWEIELKESDDFSAMRSSYTDEESGSIVNVEIIAGMSAPPPEYTGPEEEDDKDNRFGWYVACNGRIVLAADKTATSGWGTQDWPLWHNQYAGFIGIVLFSAASAASLPLTTTKRSVDTSSDVYRRARLRMRDVSKRWIAYTNVRKQAVAEARKKEEKAASVPIYRLQARSEVRLPSLSVKKVENPANVNYSVSRQRMRKMAKALGRVNMTYRDVGLKTFDYAYDELVEDDD